MFPTFRKTLVVVISTVVIIFAIGFIIGPQKGSTMDNLGTFISHKVWGD